MKLKLGEKYKCIRDSGPDESEIFWKKDKFYKLVKMVKYSDLYPNAKDEIAQLWFDREDGDTGYITSVSFDKDAKLFGFDVFDFKGVPTI